MGQTKNAIRKKRRHQRKRGRRHNRVYWLMRSLFPIFAFLFVAAICMTAFLSVEGKQADPQVVSVSASNGAVQSSTPQTASGSLPSPEPIAAGTWKLILVNSRNPLPEGYSVKTVTLKNGLAVDARCYPDLQAMMDACRADGLSPLICSAYRTEEDQERLFQNKVDRLIAQGCPKDDAPLEAAKVVAVPETSEHQLGLAMDIVDSNHQALDESQERTAVQKWLMKHSWEYGFILRYPNGKSEITGIIYEPWHYRYVGREDAAQIHALGVCLEEYLEGVF